MWEKLRILATEMIESGASGIPADGAPGRFATGEVATLSGFTWLAPAIEAAQPAFDWTFIPFPGSDNAGRQQVRLRQVRPGLDDRGRHPEQGRVAGLPRGVLRARQLPGVRHRGRGHPDPARTRPSTPQLGRAIAPSLGDFRIGWERYWIPPTGAGQFAFPYASFFKPFGEFDTAQQAADAAQADLQAGLDASQ